MGCAPRALPKATASPSVQSRQNISMEEEGTQPAPPTRTPGLRRVSGTSEPQTPAKLNPELCSGAGSPGQAASVRDIPPRGTRLTTSQRQIITTQHSSSGSCPGWVPALCGADPRSPTLRTVTCARLLPGTLPAALPRSRSRGCPTGTLLVSQYWQICADFLRLI